MVKSRSLILLIILIFATLVLAACKPKTPTRQSNQAFQNQITSQKQDVDFQASFAIFTDNIFRVFTKSMYHNQSGEAFITAANPNVINVKKSPTTWGNFFNSMPMDLTKECLWTGTLDSLCNSGTKTLKFYLNGERISNFLEKEIKPNDKALITYGAETEKQIQSQLEQIPTL